MASSFGIGTARYGTALTGSAPAVAAGTTQLESVPVASSSASAPGQLFHPSNPMVALGAIVALTFGLMAFSTSAKVRVGRQTAGGSIQIGDTK